MILADLFLGFLRVGFFAFGGAYGAIPLIRDVVLSYGWLTGEMLTCMIAVSESTPGPIMVNLATYVGNSQAGFAGAVIATLAVVAPSFFVILALMLLLRQVLRNRYVQALLRGMKPCMTGIILATGLAMILNNCFSLHPVAGRIQTKNLVGTVLLLLLYYGSRAFKKPMSPILLIAISACIGLLIF